MDRAHAQLDTATHRHLPRMRSVAGVLLTPREAAFVRGNPPNRAALRLSKAPKEHLTLKARVAPRLPGAQVPCYRAKPLRRSASTTPHDLPRVQRGMLGPGSCPPSGCCVRKNGPCAALGLKKNTSPHCACVLGPMATISGETTAQQGEHHTQSPAACLERVPAPAAARLGQKKRPIRDSII